MEAHTTPLALTPTRKSGGQLVLVHGFALAAAGFVALITAGEARWNLGALAVIATLTVLSDLTSIETGSRRLKISASFLGLILAAVLLGGAPAALIGVLTIAIGWVRWREAGHYLRNNLVAFAWFPLIAGLCFHAVAHATHLRSHDLGYYLLTFAVFMLALLLNFVMVAGYQCYLDRSPLRERFA